MRNRNIKQGIYRIKFPEKYLGSLATKGKETCVYRSSWELACFNYLDGNPNIECWGSEIVKIPYKSRLDALQGKNKVRNYFMDIFFKTVTGNCYIIEIKPDKETRPPSDTANKTKWWYHDMQTFLLNQDKWNAATIYAKEKGWMFQIWTEHIIDKIKTLSL